MEAEALADPGTHRRMVIPPPRVLNRDVGAGSSRSVRVIRDAVVDDADALGLITVSASFDAFLGQIPEELLDLDWRPEDSAEGWRRVVSRLASDELFLVAEVGGRVAGFVWAGSSSQGGHDEGEVKGLYVLPSEQGAGLGRSLVVAAAQRLRQAGMSSLLIGWCPPERSINWARRGRALSYCAST